MTARNGVGTAGATGALVPAMLKLRGRKYLFAPSIISQFYLLRAHLENAKCTKTLDLADGVGANRPAPITPPPAQIRLDSRPLWRY